MTLVVLITGAWGWIASWILLQWGVQSMLLRYPLAVLLSYPIFIGLIGLWLHIRWRDWAEWPLDMGLPEVKTGARPAQRVWHSEGGGDFAGAGVSSSFEAPATAGAPSRLVSVAKPDSSSHSSDPFEWAGEGWELAVLGLALGGVMTAVYLVYLAPVLLAEVLVDGALAYALLRRVRGLERRQWWRSVLSHTWLPFVLAACFVAAIGALLQGMQPNAHTIGQVMQQL